MRYAVGIGLGARLGCMAIVLFGMVPTDAFGACADDPDRLLDEIAVLESVDGDCTKALELADSTLACLEPGDPRTAAFKFRKALCLIAIGNNEEGLRILDRLQSAATVDAAVAREAHRVLSRIDTRRRIHSLPYHPAFSELPPAIVPRDPAERGLIIVQPPDRLEPVLRWRTEIRPNDADYLTIPIAVPLSKAVMQLEIAVVGQPLVMYLYLVDGDGNRYQGQPIRIGPEDGWARFQRDFSTFHAFQSSQARQTPNLADITYLMFQDATAFEYDLRGAHDIHISDFTLYTPPSN